MRLWSLHPRYLDARGLVALWREALLAQAVLGGKTHGYTRHPQLLRFRRSPSPRHAIAFYLLEVYAEAVQRGYHFDQSKIGPHGCIEQIPVTYGQLHYEWMHLMTKLKLRDPARFDDLKSTSDPESHPLFLVTPGPIEEWEVTTQSRT